MPGIFLSYRRNDSLQYARRIYNNLSKFLRTKSLFIDEEAINPGEDFADVIEDSVKSCDVLLAIIGPNWLIMTDNDGRNRLENYDDFVKLEITTALSRNITVIPLLVGGAKMPLSNELPNRLKTLSRRNAFEIRDEYFEVDVSRLINYLEKLVNKDDNQSDSIENTKEANLAIDYNDINRFLQAEAWKEADLATSKLILEVIDYRKRGWLKESEIKSIPDDVLVNLDERWAQASNGQFGLSVQKNILANLVGQPNRVKNKDFRSFGEEVGWRIEDIWLQKYSDFTFSKSALTGHLPTWSFPSVQNWSDKWQISIKSFLTHSVILKF